MEKGLVGILKNLQKNLEKIQGKNGKKLRYLKEIGELVVMYSNLVVTEEFSEKYKELIKRGSELNEGENFRNIKKMDKFLPDCFYLYYSIKGELDIIMKKLMYSFFVTAILFMITAFPLYPTLLTLIFVPTMYIGVKGLTKRSARGLTVGRALIEFSTLTGFIAIAFVVIAIPKFNTFLDGLVKHYKSIGINLSTSAMTMCVAFYVLIAIGLAAVSLYNSYYYRRFKKLFN
jgi:hypothetical protein